MKEAELIKLRQQLQPHFLFNSLNSISALTTAQPLEARKMVVQLSEFLRGTLKQEDHLITLNEELDHLKLYLDIEKIRFGHRLTVDFDASEESMNQLLPSLLLLPLVENSIKFGLYDTVGEIKITIACNMTPNYLLIQIQNPFDKKNTSPLPGTGYGLSSIHRRLYLLYARQDLLLTHTDESIFTTSLKIPIA